MPGPFYFAWCDPEELNSFGEEHHVEDEELFSLEISQLEGEFPTATCEIRNPNVGLLGPGRKRWAWFSYRDGEGTVHPLLFGRLVGVPEQLVGELVRLVFIARPVDYEAQKIALAETLKVAPWWDELWFSEDDRRDPDKVLEGRPAVWHVDRVTHVVTVSEVIEGDSIVDISDDAFHDSVRVGYTGAPVRKVVVDATVRWDQTAAGTIDVTKHIADAFKAAQRSEVKGIDGTRYSTRGQMVIATGEQMINSWPREGARIGGGWTVGNSDLIPVGLPPTKPLLMRMGDYTSIIGGGLKASYPRPYSETFERGPGLVVQIIDWSSGQGFREANTWRGFMLGIGGSTADRQILWLPLWRMKGFMNCVWDAKRGRTERVHFELVSDVQSVLSEPGEEEVVFLSLGPADVDNDTNGNSTDTDDGAPPYIGDLKNKSYFKTERGQMSLQHAVARARATLQARARIVEVQAQVPAEMILSMDCRKECYLADERVPGGEARGKVLAYSLRMDGETGVFVGSVSFGCAVGKGGSVTPTIGTPTYVETGYVNTGYQYYEGATAVLPSDDVSIEDIAALAVDDDGIDFNQITADGFVIGVTVEGGLTTQEEQVEPSQTESNILRGGRAHASALGAIDKVNGVETKITLQLKPVTGGPFETILEPVVSELKLPKMIDLEAVAP